MHIGDDILVFKKDILLIIDAKRSEGIDINKEFFQVGEEEGFFICRVDNPKSYIVTQRGNEDNRIKKGHIKTYIYESKISANTLIKRFISNSN